MLKSIMASIITFIMIFSLTGCSDINIEMLMKLNEASKWDAVQNTEEIKLEFNYQDETYAIELSTETYSKNKEIQSEGNITFKSVYVNGVKLDLTSGVYKISPIKFYVDKFKIYIETAGVKDIYSKLGIPVTSQLEPSYVGLDMDKDIENQLGILGMTPDDIVTGSEESIKQLIKLNVNLPVHETENTYSINLNDVQIVKLVMDFMFEYYTVEGGVLDQLAVTGEERDDIIAELEKQKTEETVKVIEDSLKGSNVDASFKITDNSIDSKMNLDLKFNNGVEQIGMLLNATSKSSKVDMREIEFPKEAKLYTINEIMDEGNNLSTQEEQIIVINYNDLKNINGLSYVPARIAFNQVGIELVYDVKTKQVFAKVEGEQIPIEVDIINGVSYIEAKEFEQTYGVSLQIR